jgi:glycosyltransferase involved in cell wall biosynthesis
MAARTVDLLTDPDRRAAFGQAGRENAVTSFSRSKIVDEYEVYYRRILAG